LFVVDAQGSLAGVVSMRQLIMTAANTPLIDIMNSDVRAVLVGTDEEECARLMSHYDLLALPVVDENNILLGIVTIDDVVDVLKETATEDIQRFGGSEPLERAYLNTHVLTVVRKRVGWLLLLFVTGSLTSTVLRLFENELETLVELAFFVPLLIGTGGNAGSQTTSTIISALAVGEIRLSDALRTLWHELRIGITLGVILAIFAFGRVLLQGISPEFSLTVAVSILTIVIWATALGSLLPLLVTRLRLDPAAVSGPVMSTLVDATGLLIYFSVARLMLGL
jgi:magnesium transporter